MNDEDDALRLVEELRKLARTRLEAERSRTAPPLATFVPDRSRELTPRSANAISLAIDEYKEREGRPEDCPDYISPLKRIARSNEVGIALALLECKLSSYDDDTVRSLLFELVVNAAYEETDWNQQLQLPADQAKELDKRADLLNECAARITADLDIERKRWKKIRPESLLDRMAGEPVAIMGRFSAEGKKYLGAVEVQPTVDMIAKMISSLVPVMRTEAQALKKRGQEGKGLRDRRHFILGLDPVFSKYIREADQRRCSEANNATLAALYNAALNCTSSDAATPREMSKLRSKVRRETIRHRISGE